MSIRGGAGVIPVMKNPATGEILLVLGEEEMYVKGKGTSKWVWGDFGGKANTKFCHVSETAARELHEETSGKSLPINVRTDAESLLNTMTTMKRPRDLRLYADICGLREDKVAGLLRSLKHTRDEDNLSDPPTKRHVSEKKKEKVRQALTLGLVHRPHSLCVDRDAPSAWCRDI